MRRLFVITIISILFITTSSWALDTTQIKVYVEKHFEITKKLKQIKALQQSQSEAIKNIRAKYNYNAMVTEIQAINDIYKPQIDVLNAEYNALVEQLESQ